MTLGKKAFENIVGKGKIMLITTVLSFSIKFWTLQRQFQLFSNIPCHLKMLLALSQKTYFELFQTERVCRREFLTLVKMVQSFPLG